MNNESPGKTPDFGWITFIPFVVAIILVAVVLLFGGRSLKGRQGTQGHGAEPERGEVGQPDGDTTGLSR